VIFFAIHYLNNTIGEMISQESLPHSLVNQCLDVMRNLASGERDLIRVIVEVIQELRDTGEAEKEEEVCSPLKFLYPHLSHVRFRMTMLPLK
jgi:hypothetical protein